MLPLLLAFQPVALPQESRDLTEGFELPTGLEVTLWAESPHLYNPAAIDVDEHGRIWVVEAVNYRKWDGRNAGRDHPKGDRVVVLEDTDGDGACDSSTVFVQDEDLTSPLGIGVIAGKVYVSCSPNLYVYEDTDGDGKANHRSTFLTGFGGYDHDHGLHSAVAGPDGMLYFNVGNAGPHIVEDAAGNVLRSGSVYRGGGPRMADNHPGLISADGRVYTGGLALRVRYQGNGLEVLAHNFRNNYELALDSYGNIFQTDNDDDGNGACRTVWTMRGGNYGFFSADGSRSWQADKRPGQDNWDAHWHQDDPGVAPAGARNGPGGPTGCCVYEGELLSRWIQGDVLNTDAGARVVYAHRPVLDGAGIELELRDFLRPKPEREDRDARWFRPSDVAVGTDGAVYVADWYDPGVGGHAAGDQEAYGRILRVAPRGDATPSGSIDVSTMTGALAAFLSPAVNVRELGRLALLASGEKGARALAGILRDDPNPAHVARAIWALYDHDDPSVHREGTGVLWTALKRAFGGDDPMMKILAVRLGEKDGNHTTSIDAVRDPHPGVRREVMTQLRDVSAEQDLPLLLELARGFDGSDRTYLEAFGLAAEGDEELVYTTLLAEIGDMPRAWNTRFEGLAWRLHPPAAVPAFLARALEPALPKAARRRAIDALAFTKTREAAEAVLTIAQIGPEDLRGYAGWWIKNRDGNDWRAFGLGQNVKRGAIEDAELVWESDIRSEGLIEVDADIVGAETLWLVVTDGGNGNSCDWADWISPRFEGPGGTWKLAETSWISADAGWGSVQAGKNCKGGELAVGPVRTADGIGTHAASRIAFAVPEGATRLVAQAGPDNGGTSQECGTSIVFQVWVTRIDAPAPTAAWEAVVVDASRSMDERHAAAEALARDPNGALRLIRLVEDLALDDALIGTVAAVIHTNPDLGVRALASEHFTRPGQDAAYPSVASLLLLQGDPRRGRTVFQDNERAQCVTCHAFKLGDTTLGGDVGPDLTSIGTKYDAAALFDAILNPTAGIAMGYDTWLLETRAGELYTGFLLADGPTVVLKDNRGERHVFDAAEIVYRSKQDISTMPEGAALGVTPQELADLVAFLREGPVPDVTPGEQVVLFDGTSLEAWTHHLPEGAAMEDVWSIEEGVLICKGNPIGYLRTKETFESYVLTLEWRFDPQKGAGNSGVLLRMIGEDKVWPRSIEAQLQSGNAGDIWNIDQFSAEVAPDRTRGRRTIRRAPSSEKPLGEWNRYTIFVVGPRVALFVNDVLQNTADWCEEVPGSICLQSEGAEIHFRDIRLQRISR